MMARKAVLPLFFVLSLILIPEANAIKVLILDDVFQNVPGKDDVLVKMGNVRGDLFVNGNHYRGDIEVWKGIEGLYLVNELPLEDYVKNVVFAEVGISWDMEALKAQAVVARTYALYQIKNQSSRNFDLTSSVLHQVYKGSSIDWRIAYAVENTAGEVLTYNGEIIQALYHSACGGRTENAEDVFSLPVPYLKSVESSCELSPYWIWERTIPYEELEKAFNIRGIRDISISAWTSTQRVKSVDITHEQGKMTVKANEFRKAVGWKRVPSTKFELRQDKREITLEGHGYGHGVGLCQWSALEMAKKGKNYKDILVFYYPGTAIQMHENR